MDIMKVSTANFAIKDQEEYAMYVIMGATSNIGSKLANIFLDKGEKVKVMDRSTERLKPSG